MPVRQVPCGARFLRFFRDFPKKHNRKRFSAKNYSTLILHTKIAAQKSLIKIMPVNLKRLFCSEARAIMWLFSSEAKQTRSQDLSEVGIKTMKLQTKCSDENLLYREVQ